MIDKQKINGLAEDFLKTSECYLVDITIKQGNLIIVEIDHDEAVGIEDCVALSRFIEEHLDRDLEDFELEVTSSGISSPFKNLRQYIKNIGSEVEILLLDGRKLSGILESADEKQVTIAVEVKVKPEGAKRKKLVCEDQVYTFNEIKYTKKIIRFK